LGISPVLPEVFQLLLLPSKISIEFADRMAEGGVLDEFLAVLDVLDGERLLVER